MAKRILTVTLLRAAIGGDPAGIQADIDAARGDGRVRMAAPVAHVFPIYEVA